MSNKKPKVILDLEQEVGFKLIEVELDNVSHYYNRKSLSKNENGDITGLNLGWEEISNLNSLTNLKEIKTLSLYNTQVSDVSPLNLKNLQILDLNKTQVSDVSPLKDLNNLIELHLRGTQVSDVSSLKDLKNLQILDLSETQVIDVSPLKDLNNLQRLYLSGTQVIDVSPLKDLKNLQTLDLKGTQVIDVSLKDLKNLAELYLSETQVIDVSPLKDLKNLQRLDLSKTQVIDVSPLKDLNNLTKLYLSKTQVTDVSLLTELPKLYTLDVRHCKIKTIPLEMAEKFHFAEWVNKLYLGTINLYGNPIEDFIPPEIINQGQKAVVAYLKSKGVISESERIALVPLRHRNSQLERNITSQPKLAPLNEVKTLILGGGGCGKTSLLRRLVGQHFNPEEDQTHGIRILKHPIKYKDQESTRIDVHFWDFGGQEINHATHQFFYSTRSLYLLVLDARRQEQQAEYWLKYIENLGGNSPVLVVLNKIDENPAFEVNRRFLLEKYPNIKAFYRVACSNDTGINDFRKAVHQTLYNLESRKMELAPSWLAVKEALSNMQENYISYDRYFEICVENKVTDSDAQETLRSLVHQLGLALDFENLRRYDKQVLNPKWITNGVYRIINSPQVGGEKGQGVLHFAALDSILHDWERYDDEEDKKYRYPEKTHLYLTGIMQEFELCYTLDKDTFIVPDLLPVQEPAGLDYTTHPLHFVIRYEDLLPRSVMPRFMVQMHHRIPEGTDKRWRTGVVVNEALYKAAAIIRADYAEKEIHIWVKGEQRQRMLSFIRQTFDGIRSSFSKLNVSEWVMIPNTTILVKYSTLLAHENKNREFYFCPELEQDFKVVDLLNGIEIPESRAETHKIRAFISYSHKDETLKEQFKAHLKPLTYEYGLDLWDDREIDAGKKWEDEIISHLESDALLFLLISSDSIASDDIWQKEIPKAIERHNKGKAIVIPVILRPCAWQGLDFGKIQALPKDAQPITTWDNEDSAWLDAVQQIEKVLKGERVERLLMRRFL